MFRLTRNAVTAASPERKSPSFRWETPKISEKAIWDHCLEVLKWYPVDIAYVRSLCQIIKHQEWKYDIERRQFIRQQQAWKCDIERMIQIYETTSLQPAKNDLRTMFLDIFSNNPHPMTAEEQEKLYQLQKTAINELDSGFLNYLCQLSKRKPTETTRSQQVQLLNIISKKHANGTWEWHQAQKYKSILLRNLPPKSKKTMQVAAQRNHPLNHPVTPNNLREESQVNVARHAQETAKPSAAVIVPITNAAESKKVETFLPTKSQLQNDNPLHQGIFTYAIRVLFKNKKKTNPTEVPKRTNTIIIQQIMESAALSPVKRVPQPKQNLLRTGDLGARFRLFHGLGVAESYMTFVADIFGTRERSGAVIGEHETRRSKCLHDL